ncbi:HAD family hydrolase [Planctomycetota bacterium]
MPYRHIIWDWNGTLLNDSHACVTVLNEMLALYDKPSTTHAQYLMDFDFPVSDYYERLGFNFDIDAYDRIADQYIAIYRQRQYDCPLHEGALAVLANCRDEGLGQSILSAYHTDLLHQIVAHFELTHFFKSLVGLDDLFAASKIDRGRELLSQIPCPPAQVLLIGDTTHDHEVAQSLGIDCILLCGGHQHEQRLRACGPPVLSSIRDVPRFLTTAKVIGDR